MYCRPSAEDGRESYRTMQIAGTASAVPTEQYRIRPEPGRPQGSDAAPLWRSGREAGKIRTTIRCHHAPDEREGATP
jgi:hypothetical protein